MNYTKPQVADLGKAVRMIEAFPLSKPGQIGDGTPNKVTNPAYDLDE